MLALAAVGCLSIIPAVAQDTSDEQIWAELQYSHPLSNGLGLVMHGILRSGDGARRPVYDRVGGSLDIRINDHLSLAPSYAFIARHPDGSDTFGENRLYFDATLQWPLLGFILAERNRVEWQFFSTGTTFRYRNWFQIERTVSMVGRRIHLFVSDEILYDGRLDAWARNRFTVGAGKAVGAKADLEVYYAHQNDLRIYSGDWRVVGVTLKLRR